MFDFIKGRVGTLFKLAPITFPSIPTRNRGKGQGGVPAILILHRSIRSAGNPERPRHWHNPADPFQAARIEAAREKRQRKAAILADNMDWARIYNVAHTLHGSLDPFHVVRS